MSRKTRTITVSVLAIVLVILVAGGMLSHRESIPRESGPEAVAPTVSQPSTEPEINTESQPVKTLEPDLNGPDGADCSVSFYVDGQLYDKRFGQNGQGITPPAAGNLPGKIFRGWDQNLLSVSGHLTVNAVWESVEEVSNALVGSYTYVQPGEKAVLDVILCGKVQLSAADFVIRYNPEKFTMDEVPFADSAMMYHHIPEKGEIWCSLLFDDNVCGEVSCMQLTFTPLLNEVFDEEITITIEDSAYYDGEKVADIPASAFNGRIIRTQPAVSEEG